MIAKGETESEHSSDEQPTLSLIRTEELIKELDQEHREQQAKPIKPDPCVKVRVGNLEARALVDTGADITAITLELYKELEEKKIPMTTIPIRKFPVSGAFSDREETIGMKTSFGFTIGEKEYKGNF